MDGQTDNIYTYTYKYTYIHTESLSQPIGEIKVGPLEILVGVVYIRTHIIYPRSTSGAWYNENFRKPNSQNT